MRLLVLVGLLFADIVGTDSDDLQIPLDPVKLVSDANGHLAIQLYRTLQRLAPGQNIVFSPVVISAVLAIAASGARGRTQQEICQVMGIEPEDVPFLKKGFQDILESFRAPENNCTLNIASGLFFSDGYAFRHDFVDYAVRYYDAIIERLDFREHPEASRETINSWIANRTDNAITQLLPAGSVNALTLLIMATAIHFNAGWLHPFDINKSKLRPFNLAVNVAEDMVMMRNKKRYRFADLPNLKFKILEMPYSSGLLGLYVLRPDDIDGVDALAGALNVDLLNNIMDNIMLSREVTLTFPHFTVSQDISLRSILGHLGVTELFSPALADLSAMSKGAELSISELAHKVRLEITESGTEGVGGIGQIIALAAEKKIFFNVDRPFMFIIRHQPSRTILFIGRIVKPPAGDTSIGDYLERLERLNHAVSWQQNGLYMWQLISLCLSFVLIPMLSMPMSYFELLS